MNFLPRSAENLDFNFYGSKENYLSSASLVNFAALCQVKFLTWKVDSGRNVEERAVNEVCLMHF